MADRGPQRSDDRSVTDKDREAARTAMRAADHAHGSSAKTECYAQAIATARAEEREACAKACGAPDEDPSGDDPCSGNDGDTFDWAVQCASFWNAAAIRARGED